MASLRQVQRLVVSHLLGHSIMLNDGAVPGRVTFETTFFRLLLRLLLRDSAVAHFVGALRHMPFAHFRHVFRLLNFAVKLEMTDSLSVQLVKRLA